MKVLFFLRKIGPYHNARFLDAAKSIDLTAVETRPGSREYSWNFSAGSDYPVESFPVVDAETGIRGQLLKSTVALVIEKHNPDAIVTTGWADREYHAVALHAIDNGIPLIVISDSRYEDVPRRAIAEFVKQIVLRSFSSALVAGTASRDYLLKLGFHSKAIYSPWDVVDNNYFLANRKSSNFAERYFLCVSRLIEKKNLFALIDAFSEYRVKGGTRKLLLAGDGILENTLRHKVAEKGLNDVVSFVGFVQYDELPSLLSCSFCLILPSTSDQWGLVVNEAMASGVPVLVSKACGCAADLVQHKKNGFIFDPLSIGDMSNTLWVTDQLSETSWKKMSEFSVSIIDKYRPADFTQGLVNAARYAIEHPRKKRFGLIHKILGR